MTISEVNANNPVKQDSDNTDQIPITLYFGVFFDGTNNNMVQAETARELRKKYGEKDNLYDTKTMRLDEVNVVKDNDNRETTKYSNIAILHSYYVGISEEEIKNRENKPEKIKVYKIYVEGAGANDINCIWNGKPIVGLGFGLGKTGVTALVSKAVRAIKVILEGYTCHRDMISLKFDIFGFSRGAACARLFSYLIARGNEETLPSGREKEFGKYFAKEYYIEGRLEFLKKEEWKEVSIDFLGIYDTVVSIGFLRRKKEENGVLKDEVNGLSTAFAFNDEFKENFHDLNVREYGQYSPQMKDTVKNCLHIGAMDEFRENFAFTSLGKDVPINSLEVLLPGCHSDIGGGYIDSNSSTVNFKDFKTLQYYIKDPQNKNTAQTAPLNKQLLVNLGWGNSDEVKETVFGGLKVKRKVPSNYCSVPLRLMIERTLELEEGLKRGKKGMFILPDTVYMIPIGLQPFKDVIQSTITGKKGERLCIFPYGGYSGINYQTLRLNYLHFTSSDTVFVKLANGANFKSNVVCRIVYHGDKEDTTMHYMSDFSLPAIEKGFIYSKLIGDFDNLSHKGIV